MGHISLVRIATGRHWDNFKLNGYGFMWVYLLFNFSWHLYKKDRCGIPAPYFVMLPVPIEAQVLTLFLVIHGAGGNFRSVLSRVVGRTLRGSEEGIGIPHG